MTKGSSAQCLRAHVDVTFRITAGGANKALGRQVSAEKAARRYKSSYESIFKCLPRCGPGLGSWPVEGL